MELTQMRARWAAAGERARGVCGGAAAHLEFVCLVVIIRGGAALCGKGLGWVWDNSTVYTW